MRKYREYTDEDVINNAKTVYSIAGLLKSLNLKPCGGNYANIKRLIQELKIDTSHWKGQGWNKNQQLKDWKEYTRSGALKKHLLATRGNVCECCKLSEWMGKPIKLELHHIDGDKTNNSKENLKLLCPNCHSFTDTWRSPTFLSE